MENLKCQIQAIKKIKIWSDSPEISTTRRSLLVSFPLGNAETVCDKWAAEVKRKERLGSYVHDTLVLFVFVTQI